MRNKEIFRKIDFIPNAASRRPQAVALPVSLTEQLQMLAAKMRGEGLGLGAAPAAVRPTTPAAEPLAFTGRTKLELLLAADARLRGEGLFQPQAAPAAPRVPAAARIPEPEELLFLELKRRYQGEKNIVPMAAKPREEAAIIPYIGDDRRYYNTSEALRDANEAHRQATHRLKSPVTGKEYPISAAGLAQMRADERAHYSEIKLPRLEKIENLNPKIEKENPRRA